jgi:hypothetical protein
MLGHRSLLLGLCVLLLVTGCDIGSPWGSGGNGSAYGASVSPTGGGTGGGTKPTNPTKPGVGGESTVAGSDDTAVATVSVPSAVVKVGAQQTVSVTFTSSDGLAMTGFGIANSLGTLPAGWSGPSTFTCALVAAGSDCVLNLTFTPTATGNGSVTLDYIYIDNAQLSKVPGGTVTIPYEAIADQNVLASATPTGQINANVGAGAQTVSVNFWTDDGFAATNLALSTDLTALPAGWSSAASSFSCPIVSTGNGCQLILSYAPTAAARGTFTLSYTYIDSMGAARSAALNVPYASTSSNNVVASVSPSGQILAVENTGGQSVAVAFASDDGKAASDLVVTTKLSALPAGWHSSSGSFSCGSVGTGNGCLLMLTYAPTALTSGTLTLGYAYKDAGGTEQTGTLNIEYAGTTNDNVVATPSPAGQINAVVGNGAQAVTVTFTSDDARSETAFAITSSLMALPSGWSSSVNSLACSSVLSGTGCQLTLTYAPTVRSSGTLLLNYGYKNNDEQPKTGSVTIPYRATTNDNVVGTPDQVAVSVVAGSSSTVNVAFTTDDANPASALSITSGLTPLPAGWTSNPGSLTCATVSAGTACQIALTYSPTAAAMGTLSLGFSYQNDSAIAKTGSVNIPYAATTNNNVLSVANPSPLSVLSGTSTPATVTFTTDDGNPATALSITSGLAALPAGFSSASGSSFSCASVSVGVGCQLALTYSPLIPDSGTLSFGFTYTNNSGVVKTGTATLVYSAT